jgi:hypothetical protein
MIKTANIVKPIDHERGCVELASRSAIYERCPVLQTMKSSASSEIFGEPLFLTTNASTHASIDIATMPNGNNSNGRRSLVATIAIATLHPVVAVPAAVAIALVIEVTTAVAISTI